MSRRGAAIPVVAGTVLLLALYASAVGGPWTLEERNYGSFGGWWTLADLEPWDMPEMGELEPVTSEPRTPPDLSWLRPVVYALALLGVALFVAWIVQRFLRSRPRAHVPVAHQDGVETAEVPEEPELAVLRRGAEESRRMLEADTDPADAIIAAWLTLERAAERSGVTRRPAHTPTEFAVVVLDRTTADPRATAGLLELYRRARFSRHRSGPDDVAAAIGHLRVLSESLEGTVPEPSA